MQIEQLYYFCTIVDKKTYSEAAFHLHLSQSALSKQIQRLEKELGVSLFDRTHRQITLSEAGQQLYNDAKNVLKEYEVLRDHSKAYQHQENTLTLGMLPIFSQYKIGKEIVSYLKKENIKVAIEELEERDFPLLEKKDMDALLLREEESMSKKYDAYLIAHDEICVVVEKHHPLANQKEITLQQLQTENILCYPAYTSVSKNCKKALQAYGMESNITRYARLETLLGAVKEKEGCALVVKEALKQYQLEGVSVLSLTQKIDCDLYLYVHRKCQKDEMKKLLAFLKQSNLITVRK